MKYYDNELAALKRSGRYRERRVFDPAITDLASNDYLGLAEKPELFNAAVARLSGERVHAPKASMLVNGYHAVHREFEAALCEANGFESGIVMGSGFNANLAMIEALVRRGDELFMDEKYHASGVLASKLVEGKVTLFGHNDAAELEKKLSASDARRRIIAVEGIYSMDGDLMAREIFELAERYDALLIVDEAHSSGVVGSRLLGVFDLYGITPKRNHIKMGTLGKAYGSFGAYVLSSSHIADYLVNRAKPVIYATAPSLFDTALAQASLHYILENAEELKAQIEARRAMMNGLLGTEADGLIAAVPVGDNRKVMAIQAALLEEGMLVGAIRQPTVERAIIRLIGRLGVEEGSLRRGCEIIARWVK
ncbi:pyridoxal phosphate-dependent aminotransferase family protein [Sulfurimonas sp. HSL1-6]|uniref:aminotransferase class I/II-fold pyridoxal phosphate-dependent enzyme n=1 Tax=Thiomicrolovo immobilis TaxID=3131935 RepID=UPI0031F72C83